MKDMIRSPQVIAALITSSVALFVAFFPMLMNRGNASEATPAPITQNVVETATEAFATTSEPQPTMTPVVDEATATTLVEIEPTNTQEIPTATPIIPTDTMPPLPTDIPPANLLLLYDDASFTLYNQSSQTLSITNLQFESSNGSWQASQWGENLASALSPNNCLRLRDANSGERQPPAVCGSLLGLQLIGGGFFWLTVDEFTVKLDNVVIATCSTIEATCPIFVP